MGELKKAKMNLDSACKNDNKNAQYYATRGDILLELGEHSEALDDYDATIALNPKESNNFINRAKLYLFLG